MTNTSNGRCDVEGCKSTAVADLVGTDQGLRCIRCLEFDLDL